MKRCFFAVPVLAGVLMLSAQAPPADQEIRAMRDEMERSKKLTINNLEGPYFLQYMIEDSDSFSVTASLGGLLSKRRQRDRQPMIQLRVGDYKFDNSNFASGGFGFGSRYDVERFPLEDSYPLLRRYLWLETDSAYKLAVELLSRKRAALRNLTQSEQLNDFAKAEPVRAVKEFQKLGIDEDAWTNRVRSLSAIFSQYADIRNSSVDLEASAGGYTIVNSEGTEAREPENVTYLRARAIAQAPDGMGVGDTIIFHAFDAQHLPGDAELTRGVKALAENVGALARAPKGEDYSGPVLFEGTAGAQLIAEVLGRNLSLTRRPVVEGGRGGGAGLASELEGRIGARVFPDSFEVIDDPTQKEWRGRPLFGAYSVDHEGAAAKPVRLIEKGVLKGYLLTRQPVRGYEGSNGRARLPGAFGAHSATISNLFVNSSEGVPVSELKKKLIELCQTRGKPYGLIVRKMDFPSSGTLDGLRRGGGNPGGGRPVNPPVLVYKIFPDGREELVRGLRFRGLNVRSFKDTLAAGNDATPFEYLERGASGFGGAFTEAVVIAPSLLIDDLELHPAEEESPNLPVVPAPELTNR